MFEVWVNLKLRFLCYNNTKQQFLYDLGNITLPQRKRTAAIPTNTTMRLFLNEGHSSMKNVPKV